MRAPRRAAAFGVAFLWFASGPLDAATVRPFESTSLQEVSVAHQGRPVIIHFWGLTCGNCMAELKDWGRFAMQHPDGLIVFVNWDRRGTDQAGIDGALQKSGLGALPSYALGEGFEEKLRFAVDRDWMGELPYTRLIADDGTVSTFSGSTDFAQLSKWLESETGRARAAAGR